MAGLYSSLVAIFVLAAAAVHAEVRPHGHTAANAKSIKITLQSITSAYYYSKVLVHAGYKTTYTTAVRHQMYCNKWIKPHSGIQVAWHGIHSGHSATHILCRELLFIGNL